jgi:crossover junction endonuclease MUS81
VNSSLVFLYIVGYMTKAELIDRAQSVCDASFVKPSDPKTHYTAWNSMGVLINKNLVHKEGNPAK